MSVRTESGHDGAVGLDELVDAAVRRIIGDELEVIVRRVVGESLRAEMRIAPTEPVDAVLVREALRNLLDPTALAASPLARGTGVLGRAASVRSLLHDAAAHAFGDTPDERLLRDVFTRGYLRPATSHEHAAEQLHLSRATYFRRLRLAIDRVCDYLGAVARVDVA